MLLSSIGNHMILPGDRRLLQINELAVFHYKLPIQKIPIPVDRRLLQKIIQLILLFTNHFLLEPLFFSTLKNNY